MAQEADAEENERGIHVIQQRPFLQALRLELLPEFGYTVNDTLHHYLQVGGTLRFHITEELSIAGNYGHYFASKNSTFEQIEEEFSLFPERSFIKWFAGGEISYIPIYGKFILLGLSTVHWNLALNLGAGVTRTFADDPLFTATLGFSVRFFITKWLTFNLGLRDHIYNEPFRRGDRIMNNLVLHTGFGLFMPFNYTYKHRK